MAGNMVIGSLEKERTDSTDAHATETKEPPKLREEAYTIPCNLKKPLCWMPRVILNKDT